MATRTRHTADVAVLAFVEDDLEPTVACALTQDGGLPYAEKTDPGADPLLQLSGHLRPRPAADLDVVGLLKMAFRRQHASGPLRVVGEEE